MPTLVDWPRPSAVGSAGPDARQVYEFIRENTRADEPVVMWEPRALTLYTDRPGTNFATFWTAEERRAYASQVGARFWVHPRVPLPASVASEVETIFENDLLRVYRFREAVGTP